MTGDPEIVALPPTSWPFVSSEGVTGVAFGALPLVGEYGPKELGMRRTAFLLSFLFAAACGSLAFDDVDSKEVSRLVEILDVDPGEVFADVGAGDGRFSIALARSVGEGGRIFATEVDPDDLKKIEKAVETEKLDNVEVVRGTQDETGLPEACCDGILLRRVYHHFQKPAAMQESMRRALKDGGLLLVIDFGEKSTWSRPEGVPESRRGHGIDKDLLLSEMERTGFTLVRELPWEDGDYALLFRAIAIPD